MNLTKTRFTAQRIFSCHVGLRRSSSTNQFYRVTGILPENDERVIKDRKFIRPKIIDVAMNLQSARPGETITVPYELTISSSFRDMWQSAFYSHDRINTSTPFSRSMGFQDQVIPFSLMLFLCGSMSHADHAKLQIGFRNARYHWPSFVGDTFQKQFIIRSLRSTSDGHNSVFTIDCELRNQRNVTVFSCEKTMLFPFRVPPSDIVVDRSESTKSNEFLDHIVRQAEILQKSGSRSISSLRPGELILHTLTRPISETQSMQLASLARLTHERHFNSIRYRKEEMLVPGGLVLGLTCSIASRDLHEVLFEELITCSFPNNLSPGDTVGALTYIESLEENVSGDIEALNIRTIGIKNMDVKRALVNSDLPFELFTGVIPKPSVLEEMLKVSSPELSKHIVCIADRRIYRQAPQQTPFLL